MFVATHSKDCNNPTLLSLLADNCSVANIVAYLQEIKYLYQSIICH